MRSEIKLHDIVMLQDMELSVNHEVRFNLTAAPRLQGQEAFFVLWLVAIITSINREIQEKE